MYTNIYILPFMLRQISKKYKLDNIIAIDMTSQLLELADGVVEEVLCDDGLHHDLQPGLRI